MVIYFRPYDTIGMLMIALDLSLSTRNKIRL